MILPPVDPRGILFSIDFEDFSHDLKRDLGLWKTGPVRSDALWRAYSEIEIFLQRVGAPRITFFCTGVVAVQAPDLVARIAADGHEIACHHLFHDEMDRQSIKEVEADLQAAKGVLEAAAGAPVRGFRAPKFRIEKRHPAQYRAVERHFDYDSSWFGGSPADLAAFVARMGLTRLCILPVFQVRVWPVSPRLKLGGSYFKLFPLAFTRRLIDGAFAAGMQPHIYLHPYEFCRSGEFLLSRAELAPLGAKAQAYWSLRQHQWSTVGNRSVEGKLAAIFGHLRVMGRLGDLADSAM